MERNRAKRFGRIVVRAALIAILALSIAAGARAQGREPGTPLTNADVVRMVKGGKSDSEVIAAIRSGNAKFDISEKKLLELHNEGVSSAVLHAIFVKGGGAVVGEQELKAQLARAALKSQKSIRVAINSRLANTHAGILAALQKQRDAASVEIAQTNLRLQTKAQTGMLGGAPRPANNSAKTNQSQNSRVALAQKPTVQNPATAGALGPERTSSAMINPSGAGGLLAQGGNTGGNAASGSAGKNGSITSRIVHAPVPVDSTALACTNDPTFRILTVSGSSTPGTFTPTDEYNLYAIKGCSFGDQSPTEIQQPTDWVHLYGPGTFDGQFEIKFWSDNEIDVSLDPSLSGFLDLKNLTLVVRRKDGQQTQKGGFNFYAARQSVLLSSIPSAWVKCPAMWNGTYTLTCTYYSPVSSDTDPIVRSSGATAHVKRFSAFAKFDPTNSYDYYDLSRLAQGWTVDPQNPPELTPYAPNCPGAPFTITYKESFGMWTAEWRGEIIRVGLEDTSCSGLIAWAPWINYSNMTSSIYGLKVWVSGPRGTDPMTGQATNK